MSTFISYWLRLCLKVNIVPQMATCSFAWPHLICLTWPHLIYFIMTSLHLFVIASFGLFDMTALHNLTYPHLSCLTWSHFSISSHLIHSTWSWLVLCDIMPSLNLFVISTLFLFICLFYIISTDMFDKKNTVCFMFFYSCSHKKILTIF